MGCRVISLPSIDNHLNQLYKEYVYFVPNLNEFSLLFEQETKKSYINLIKDFGTYHIQTTINSILNAEKKLKEILPTNEIVNGNPSV